MKSLQARLDQLEWQAFRRDYNAAVDAANVAWETCIYGRAAIVRQTRGDDLVPALDRLKDVVWFEPDDPKPSAALLSVLRTYTCRQFQLFCVCIGNGVEQPPDDHPLCRGPDDRLSEDDIRLLAPLMQPGGALAELSAAGVHAIARAPIDAVLARYHKGRH